MESENKIPIEEMKPEALDLLKKKWMEYENYRGNEEASKIKEVVFSEHPGSVGIGDYIYEKDYVMGLLNISEDALRRLMMIGELDSIIAEDVNGVQRRLFSESSVKKFQDDTNIDIRAMEERILKAADNDTLKQIFLLQDMIIRQTKYINHLKNQLLLEIRNMKEQNLDLSVYVYELLEEIKKLKEKQ